MTTEEVDLREVAEAVHDEASFVAFLHTLSDDHGPADPAENETSARRYGRGDLGWESSTIAAFLASAAAWAEDSRESPTYEMPPNTWTRCAHILFMGKYYE